MTKTPMLVALAAILTVTAVPVVQATHANPSNNVAGLSGQCYNADASQGGGGSIGVSSSDGILFPNQVPRVDLLGRTGDGQADSAGAVDETADIVNALSIFGVGTVQDLPATGSACDRYDCTPQQTTTVGHPCAGKTARSDYIEVHVSTVQVCYNASVRTDGGCPTYPTGPGI